MTKPTQSTLDQLKSSALREFDEEFGIPQPYKQRDRTMSQIEQIFNGDFVGEAIDDYKDQRDEITCLAMNDLYKRTKDFISHHLSKAYQAGVEEAKKQKYKLPEYTPWKKAFNKLTTPKPKEKPEV